jgi:hypothetical protein
LKIGREFFHNYIIISRSYENAATPVTQKNLFCPLVQATLPPLGLNSAKRAAT